MTIKYLPDLPAILQTREYKTAAVHQYRTIQSARGAYDQAKTLKDKITLPHKTAADGMVASDKQRHSWRSGRG